MAKRRRKTWAIALAVTVALTITVNVAIHVNCEVNVTCDMRCHQTQALLQLAEWEANREQGIEQGRWSPVPNGTQPNPLYELGEPGLPPADRSRCR